MRATWAHSGTGSSGAVPTHESEPEGQTRATYGLIHAQGQAVLLCQRSEAEEQSIFRTDIDASRARHEPAQAQENLTTHKQQRWEGQGNADGGLEA